MGGGTQDDLGCLRLAENSKNKHPQSAPTDIFEKNSEQYSKQSVLSIFERLLTAILSKFCSLLFTLYADGGRFVVPFDARPWLDKIETQTLVLTGGKDSLVPEHISSEIINGLKNVESKIFTDATHGIPWTHDQELSEELDRFLDI